MKNRPTCPGKSRNGFTLVELLVSMAITAVLMLALFSLVGQATTSYTQNQRAVNAVSQARAFIQFFDRELSTRLPATRLIHEKGTGSGAAGADRIAFVRAISADEEIATDPGDLNTSFYYVAYSADGADAESPKLFRGNLGAALTQALLTAGGSPVFPATDPATDEPIVPNIIAFQARPKFFTGNPAAPQDWTETSPSLPSAVELTVSFLDESSARRFRTRADWERLATAPRDNELQLIRTFTRTIAIAK